MKATSGRERAPLPPAACKEIGQRYPKVSLDYLEQQLGTYLAERAVLAELEPPKAMRRRLVDFSRKLDALLASGREISEQELDRAIRFAARTKDQDDEFDAVLAGARRLRALVPDAIQLVSGRPFSPRQGLAAGLAGTLSAAGYKVDQRPSGALCQILEIVLMAAGEKPSSTVEIVKPVLKGLAKSWPADYGRNEKKGAKIKA